MSARTQGGSTIKLRQRSQLLIISGLDPSGGAGIQADIQTATALGVHPLPVLSCLTVQDTRNVYNATAIDADLVRQQLQCLAADTPFQAIKTGALGNSRIVEVLAEFLDAHPGVPLVVDPVIKAAGGGDLADEELVASMQNTLFSRAEVVTPNGIELAQLGGSENPAQSAARLLGGGCRSVLATGGHGTGDKIVNQLYRHDQATREWALERIGGEYHGTGCTLAAAIASGLARGLALEQAIEQAQDFVLGGIRQALAVGQGQPVPDRGWRSRS